MASKKTRSSSKKELKATVKRLEAKLERADAKATRWKLKAKEHESALASSQARGGKPSEELPKERAANQPTGTRRANAARPTATRRAKTPSPAQANSKETKATTDTHSSKPDASWTLVQLHAEARSRGLTGLSGKKKAEVIAALT